jgi:hypothetical protein
MERTAMHRTKLLTILLLALVAGCASAQAERARTLVARGELDAAVAAAGASWPALREVSIEILSTGVERGRARAEAVRGLEAGGMAAAPALRRLAASTDPLASASGAAALVRLGAGDDERLLLALLRDRAASSDGEVRAVAIALLAVRASDERFVTEHLTDPDARVRLAVLSGLARTAPGGAGPTAAVISRLAALARDDPSAAVRAASLRALGRVERGAATLEAASAALRAAEPLPLQLAAIDALASVDDRRRAAAALSEVLAASGTEAAGVRAAVVLARWRDAAAQSRLEAALLGGDEWLAETAAIGAGQVGPAMRAPLLAALERGAAPVRLQAAASLLPGRDGDRAAAELRELTVEPGWLGLQAALVLARIDVEIAGARIGQALSDPDPAVRAYAAGACALVPGGLELARGALADPEERVRFAAAASVLRVVARDGV